MKLTDAPKKVFKKPLAYAALSFLTLTMTPIAVSIAQAAQADSEPQTLKQVQSEKPKSKGLDASNDRLMYQMAITDGSGPADISSGYHLERQGYATREETGQMAGQEESCKCQPPTTQDR